MPETSTTVFSDIPALADRVQKAWNAVNRDEKAFPDIAFDALGRLDPPAFRLDDVSRFLLTTHTPQPAAPRVFSDMPVNVHRGDGFYVELLIWVDGTTAIHQHSFSGAFRVVHGSSLHSVYRFEEARRINSRTRMGRVACAGMQYLRKGDRRRITSGPGGLAHALFHLERPSATLVIRTDNDPDAGPQFSLHPPGLAVDPRTPDRLDEPLKRWVRVLETLGDPVEMDDPLVDRLFSLDYGRFARFALTYPDFAARLDARTPWERALGAPGAGARRLAERFGAVPADALVRAIIEEQRCEWLRRTRAGIADPGLRFFLALLLNGRSRGQVFTALRDRDASVDPATECRDALVALAEAADDPANGDLLERCPWLDELRGVMKPLGAHAGKAAALLMTAGFTGRDRRENGDPVGRAASALAGLAPLQALRDD